MRDVHIQPVKGALQRPDPFHQRGDGQLGPVYHPRVCAYRADGRRGVVAGIDGQRRQPPRAFQHLGHGSQSASPRAATAIPHLA